MATIASLNVQLGANVAPFTKSMKAGGAQVQSFTAKIEQSASSLQKWVLGLAAGGAIVAFGRSQLQAADDAGDLADRLGLSVEALTRLQHAAQLSGSSSETLSASLEKMTRGVADAAGGTGKARTAIAGLGLDAAKLASLSPDEQFLEIARAMEGVSSQGDKVSIAMRLFGNEGASLVNVLALGSDGIRELMEESDELGKTLSSSNVRAAAEFNDELDRLKGAMGGVLRDGVFPLVKAATRLAESARSIITEFGGIGTTSIKMIAELLAGAGAYVIVSRAMGLLIASGLKVVSTLKAIRNGSIVLQGVLGGPAGLAKVAAGTAAALLAIAALDAALYDAEDGVVGLDSANVALTESANEVQESIDATADSIKGMGDSIGYTFPQVESLDEALKNLGTDRVTGVSNVNTQLVEEIRRQEKEIRKLIEGENAVLLDDLAAADATSSQLGYAKAALDSLDAVKQQAKAIKEGREAAASLNEELTKIGSEFGFTISGADEIDKQIIALRDLAELDIAGLVAEGASALDVEARRADLDRGIAEAGDMLRQLDQLEQKETAAKELKQEAGRLKESLMTPFDVFSRDLDRLREMLGAGLIDEKDFDRASEKLTGDLAAGLKNGKPDLGDAPELLVKGSAAAELAMFNVRNPRNAKDQVQHDQLDEAKKLVDEVKGLRGDLAQQVAVDIPPA